MSSAEIPDLDTFRRALSPEKPRHRCTTQLYQLLTGLESSEAPLESRVDALASLVRWVRRGPKPPPSAGGAEGALPQNRRLLLLLFAVNHFGAFQQRLSRLLTSILNETDGLHLFCEVGLPNSRGLMPETIDRLSRKLLPSPRNVKELSELVHDLFRAKDAEWIQLIDVETLAALAGLIQYARTHLVDTMTDALSMLTTRISAIALQPDIRSRDATTGVRGSPFYLLPRATLEGSPELIATCREEVQVVHKNLEQHGVSIDVVYSLDVIEQCLSRVELLLPLLSPTASTLERHLAAREITLSFVRARDRSVRAVLQSSTRLLALKVIERVGETGEHYVTTTRREYFGMLLSAGGGGLLTVGTIVLKVLVKWGHFAPLIDGTLAGLVYAISFLLVQLFGFTLATKQPSMTAAALAASIHDSAGRRGEHDLHDLVTMIARICRSQLIAFIGNIGIVVPASIAFHLIYVWRTGHAFLSAEDAHHVVESFHPLHTGTIFYAALTGVLLWSSSIAAGWLENWAVYRKLPEAIAEHPVKRFIGARTTRWFSRFMARHIAGFGGNVSLGLLLGITPSIGAFSGLPLEVRHVTLSSGSLALAACSLEPSAILHADFVWAAIGIVVILIFNFLVSFLLALNVALSAKNVGWRERLVLVIEVIRHFFRAPLSFIFPPRVAEPAPPAHSP